MTVLAVIGNAIRELDSKAVANELMSAAVLLWLAGFTVFYWRSVVRARRDRDQLRMATEMARAETQLVRVTADVASQKAVEAGAAAVHAAHTIEAKVDAVRQAVTAGGPPSGAIRTRGPTRTPGDPAGRTHP